MTLSLLRRPGAWRLALLSKTSPAGADIPSPASKFGILACLLGAAIAGYVGFRIAWLNDFMTHVDDIVPLTELLRQQLNPFAPQDLVRMSAFYTYPPGQFFFSLPLASTTSDYETALTLFRLPSLLFWLGGLGLFWRVLRALWPETPRSGHALVLVLAVVSWRGFIESSQGYAYAVTALVTATTMALTLTPRGRSWLARNVFTALAGGVILGALTWLTYQAVFVCAAALGAYAFGALLQRDWRRFWLTIPIGIGFVGPFAAVAWLCLRHVLAYASGVPGWGHGVPGPGWAAQLRFPFVAWFEVAQNNLTFVPWGNGSVIIAALALALIAAGVLYTLCRPPLRSAALPVLLFLAALVAVFTAGPYLRKFFLGPTRHTFVLQLPLLLALGLSLSVLRIPTRVVQGGIALVLLLAAWFLPQLLRGTENKVNFELIAQHFRADPAARIVDLPGSFTWDITYLARNDPKALERIRWNNQFPTRAELAAFLGQSSHAFLVSHRSPMSADVRAALEQQGFHEFRTLAAVAPLGSTELSGNLNGGNGFYFYEVTK